MRTSCHQFRPQSALVSSAMFDGGMGKGRRPAPPEAVQSPLQWNAKKADLHSIARTPAQAVTNELEDTASDRAEPQLRHAGTSN